MVETWDVFLLISPTDYNYTSTRKSVGGFSSTSQFFSVFKTVHDSCLLFFFKLNWSRMFLLLLTVLADVVSGEFEPDSDVLSSLSISLVAAPNLTLAEVFGDIFSDVTDFDEFNVTDNVDVLASGFVWSESPVYVSNKML